MRPPPTRPPFLGELETAVLEHLWTAGEADVKTVYAAIGKKRRITLNTVQSTMERLHRKGLLDRTKVSHAFVYAPCVSREALVSRIVHEVARGLAGAETSAVLSAFVDLAERAGPAELERLERLIALRRTKAR